MFPIFMALKTLKTRNNYKFKGMFMCILWVFSNIAAQTGSRKKTTEIRA